MESVANEPQSEPIASMTDKASAQSAPFDLDAALRASLRGGAAGLETHLRCVKRDIAVGQTKTTLHCYFLPLDGNGRVRFKPLVEFLRDRIVDYAIPRQTYARAYQEAGRTNSSAPTSRLHEIARRLFTNLANSGEGGELLLFAMAEKTFGFTQIICKMTLKTAINVHYHGADGAYAEARPDGGLNLYWGESKIHGDAAGSIRECLESLGPFLRELEGEDAKRSRDILLVNEFANFDDERLVEALKAFLDRDNPSSLKVRQCGFALVGFDCDAYPGAGVEGVVDEVAQSISEQLPRWSDAVRRRIRHEKLEIFDIHFVCIPMHSADQFRQYFLKALGV